MYSVIVALTGLPIGYSVIVALTGLPIGYSVIYSSSNRSPYIGYSVIVALTGLPKGYSVIVALYPGCAGPSPLHYGISSKGHAIPSSYFVVSILPCQGRDSSTPPGWL